MKPFSVKKIMLAAGFCGLIAGGLTAQQPAGEPEIESLLQEFVESYRHDAMALDADFGIRVGEQWWHVQVRRTEHPYKAGREQQYTFHDFGPHEVSLVQGPPPSPTWFFRFDDPEIFRKISSGELTASTAAARSTGADYVTFDLDDMEGFRSSQQHTALGYLTMEHFWKKDPAEVTRFSRDSSLPSHGGQIVSLYTMKDKRIAWFTLGQEEAANADRGLDKGQVPNLIIITKGRGRAQIGEQELELEPGMSIFVGPYVKHTFYNPNPEPLEGILVLYGDNADYVTGQSYLSFLEAEYTFYGENQRQVEKE